MQVHYQCEVGWYSDTILYHINDTTTLFDISCSQLLVSLNRQVLIICAVCWMLTYTSFFKIFIVNAK